MRVINALKENLIPDRRVINCPYLSIGIVNDNYEVLIVKRIARNSFPDKKNSKLSHEKTHITVFIIIDCFLLKNRGAKFRKRFARGWS